MSNGAIPGPLAEEAARLVEAIAEWAREAVGDISMPTVGARPECQICPVCQLLALVRRTQPETFGHLADASASMIAALRTVIDRHDHGGRRPTGVERIDLDNLDPGGAVPVTDDGDSSTSGSGGREALADALGVSGRRRTARPGPAARTADSSPPRSSRT